MPEVPTRIVHLNSSWSSVMLILGFLWVKQSQRQGTAVRHTLCFQEIAPTNANTNTPSYTPMQCKVIWGNTKGKKIQEQSKKWRKEKGQEDKAMPRPKSMPGRQWQCSNYTMTLISTGHPDKQLTRCTWKLTKSDTCTGHILQPLAQTSETYFSSPGNDTGDHGSHMHMVHLTRLMCKWAEVTWLK